MAEKTEDGAIPCPVTAVTLLEDRAELSRTAVLDGGLPAGTHRLRLGPVGPLAVDRSLRAGLEAPGAGADIRDVRLVRLYTPPPEGAPGPDASALRHRVHELGELMRRLEADRDRTGARVAVLDQLLDELRRDIAESAGAGAADPQRWTAELDRAYDEHTRHGEAQRLLLRRIARTRTELGSAREALDAAEEQPLVLSAFVDVVIEAGEPLPEGARLQLVHLSPCALWRPAYRAELSADGTSLALQCDAVAWQRTGEDWTGAALSFSTARTTLAAEPPLLGEDVLLLVDRTPEERKTIEVDLREVDIQTVGPADDGPAGPSAASAAALALPGVDDGGEARLLVAPAPVDLPSDGRPHRIGLASATLPATAEYSSAPELSALVTQVARFRNSTGQVLLSGPVDLIRGSGFVGRGELRFTAEGAPAELSFGSEDTFRVTRSVEESRDTTAVTGRTVITRTVRLALSRFAPADAAPLAVVVRERIPVSEITAVDVRLDKERSSPQPEGVDADGIVRYDLTLAADDRRTLTLGYEITASRSVAV
ncbi:MULTISPECIES: mucoidy inhibitor MuiA family protein [Streptacidiphilus]|uniref:Mucoidy inhibitor MuiA family protein n=1 Tax=Streptacidiphilus cavernicola TaxID=3342716 RepID=A0ABV6UN50_9ACTN|nr:mucoidy inhibitor MuiA family protein [Streptacidiphilus jeojiense]